MRQRQPGATGAICHYTQVVWEKSVRTGCGKGSQELRVRFATTHRLSGRSQSGPDAAKAARSYGCDLPLHTGCLGEVSQDRMRQRQPGATGAICHYTQVVWEKSVRIGCGKGS